MKIQLLGKKEFEIINKRTLRYPLAIAEKDYFLTVAMYILASSLLSQTLVFKGGTAIHHCYLPQSRFSEDLDFTSVDNGLMLEDLRILFESHKFFQIKKAHTSHATIKIERLKYDGILEMPNSLKVEIDCHQNVVLPAKPMPYNNVWGIDFYANTMDIREVAAEKIRAINERARYRDFYDLVLLQNKFQLNLTEIFNLVKHKEARSIASFEAVMMHWQVAKKEKHQDRIFYADTLEDKEIEVFLGSLRDWFKTL